jgi:thymidylate synthase (FAD)
VNPIDVEGALVFTSEMVVRLVAHEASDTSVVQAARVSTVGDRSAPRTAEATAADAGLIRYLMRARHGSPFEHNVMTFMISAPIFVWREFMRHRIATSYNEESARYKQLDPKFYVPGPGRNLQQAGTSAHPQLVAGSEHQSNITNTGIRRVSRIAYTTYQQLLAEGIAREVARMVLPVNIISTAFVTMNARALMNFLSLRTHRPEAAYPSAPQREIEMVAEQMEALWRELMPLTHAAFDASGRVCP